VAVAAQTPAGPSPSPARLPAVVVWDFEDRSVAAMSTLPPGRTDWLRRTLSESLVMALLRTPGQAVVDRLRLREVLAEQKLGSGALADEAARLRLGRVVGAERMVFGSFFVVGDAVQVNLRVVDTASSRVLYADEATAPFDSVMADQPAWAARVVQALGGHAEPGRAYPPALWQAHDAAAALADAGRLDEAVAALQQLLQQRADFEPAERLLTAVLQTMARR
jgi:curli biogenesis system outer membrane secretion channel CsgG